MEVPREIEEVASMEQVPEEDIQLKEFEVVREQTGGRRGERSGFRFGRSSDPKEALTNLADQIREIKEISDNDFQNVIFQVNRALAIAPQEGSHFQEELDQFAGQMIERLGAAEDHAQHVALKHLDSYADFIGLLISRRLWGVKNRFELQRSFDEKIFNGIVQRGEEDEPVGLELYKLTDLFTTTNRNANKATLLRLITTRMED